MRCCLTRTLLSYNGESVGKGGADPKPDLATQMPAVNDDGKTWTFNIRSGVHYAPPLAAVEVTAPDFVRSIERQARVHPLPGGGPNDIYSIIRGYDDFAAGKSSTISGLETPDLHTLVVRLNVAEGDVMYILASPFAVPIPALPGNPGAPYGVATGYDAGYGAVLVASGPYMIQGGEKTDFSLPPAQQRTPAGLVPGKSVTLVRNPSWHASDDNLRPAYVDRIVVTWGKTPAEAAAAVDRGDADLVLASCPEVACQPPRSQIDAYNHDPSRGQVHFEDGEAEMYLSLNVAVPPLDDVHVRRAVAYVLDRQAMLDSYGSLYGSLTGHIAADGVEDDALLNFEPFLEPDAASRLEHAKAEMAQSRYAGHDGICNVAACQHIGALGDGPAPGNRAALEATIAPALSTIGLQVDMSIVKPREFFDRIGDPANKVAIGAGYIVGEDYPSGYYTFFGQFARAALHPPFACENCVNFSLVGATSDQLRQWGYSVQAVPSIDDRIEQCKPLIGAAATQCWTVLDEYVTEDVVGEIPVLALTVDYVVPSRVLNYTYDSSLEEPALDHLALRR